MILSFSLTHPTTNKATHFIEKIMANFYPKYREEYIPKIHSFRRGFRWKAGMKIHFATGMRTKKYRCYHEGVCISVQYAVIEINQDNCIFIRVHHDYNAQIEEFRVLTPEQTMLFAANDGFNSLGEMISWFFPKGYKSRRKAFAGDLVHFTDFKY